MPSVTQLHIYLQPGKTYEILISCSLDNNKGLFPKTDGNVRINGEYRSLKKGFVSVNENVGEIVEESQDKVAIKYKHIYPTDNIIWFFAITGERVKITIQGVADIHDHASIHTGGPAYGTYFSQPIGVI